MLLSGVKLWCKYEQGGFYGAYHHYNVIHGQQSLKLTGQSPTLCATRLLCKMSQHAFPDMVAVATAGTPGHGERKCTAIIHRAQTSATYIITP